MKYFTAVDFEEYSLTDEDTFVIENGKLVRAKSSKNKEISYENLDNFCSKREHFDFDVFKIPDNVEICFATTSTNMETDAQTISYTFDKNIDRYLLNIVISNIFTENLAKNLPDLINIKFEYFDFSIEKLSADISEWREEFYVNEVGEVLLKPVHTCELPEELKTLLVPINSKDLVDINDDGEEIPF